MKSDKHRYLRQGSTRRILRAVISAAVAACVCLWLIFLPSCSAKPTNLRTLAPADSLIYLETNDLGAALQPIIDSRPFTEAAKKKPDLSALRGVQLAVAVTGFETKEEKLNEENSIGRVQPHFAAIADTHAWSWQARNFAENQLGEFINNMYGGGVNLETSPKNGGVSYVWTADDGRKAYAFVDGSLIFFGNDESSIDKCLAVRRGEGDSILKNPKLPQAEPSALVQGYVSTDGVAQLANIAGIAMAAGTGEQEAVKSFIASSLPQLIRSSVTDVSWTMTKSEQGIEDKYLISTVAEVSNVLSETMAPAPSAVDQSFFQNVPGELPTITLYKLKDPQVAWRSVLLLAQKQTDPATGKILSEFSGALFEPYGIRDAELFLSSVGPDLLTANADADGEKPFVITTVKDNEKLKRSITSDLRPTKAATDEGINFWRGKDDDIEAVFTADKLIIGSTQGVGSCFGGGAFPSTPFEKEWLAQLKDSKAPIATLGRDERSAEQIVSTLSEGKSDEAKAESRYFTETRFTKNGIERKTVSDFGLIGSIIAQLAPEE